MKGKVESNNMPILINIGLFGVFLIVVVMNEKRAFSKTSELKFYFFDSFTELTSFLFIVRITRFACDLQT